MGLGAIAAATVVGGIGSAVIASGAASSASNAATQASQQNNATTNAIYNSNKANATPFINRGNSAGDLINSALGIAPTPTNAFLTSTSPYAYGSMGDTGFIGGFNPQAGGFGGIGQQFAQQQTAQVPQGGPTAAQNAFNTFRNSDGYQFRLGQGLNAVNNNYATRGALDSGSALKALNDYAQGQASNEFGNWMAGLQGQQNTGLSASNALAGVGTNVSQQLANNNNNAAAAQGNAALASGNAWGNALGSVGNSLSQLTGSSYGNGFVNAGNIDSFMTNAGWKPPAIQSSSYIGAGGI